MLQWPLRSYFHQHHTRDPFPFLFFSHICISDSTSLRCKHFPFFLILLHCPADMSLYAHPSHVSYVLLLFSYQLSAFFCFMYGQGARRFGMKVKFNFLRSFISLLLSLPFCDLGIGWKEILELDWIGLEWNRMENGVSRVPMYCILFRT